VSLSSLYIQRPIMTFLVIVSIVLFGIIGYRLLPVSDLPNVDFPTIQVSASYPGANPDTMASAVATPLEKEFSTIAGVDSMNSSSAQGSTSISIQFVLSRNIDAAAQDVQAAIARAARNLPADLPTPPSYRKVNPGDSPILYMSLTSPTMPMSDLAELGENLLAQKISTVNGVAQVQIYGSQKYAVRIQLSPYEMAARGIGIDEVARSISDQNVNLPLGTLYGPNKMASVQANGQLTRADQYMPLIVSTRGGPTRLREIGKAVDSVENDKTAAWFFNGQSQRRAIILVVQRQPGTNTVQVAQAVKDLLPQFRDKMPASVALEVFRDSSLNIEESANDVQFTLLLTLALVVMVIFLFLRNFSATAIPSLTLPVAIIGTFAIMYVLDYSLDNLSLMALTLSIGFVVDDAIVMLENIVRHMEMGKSRMQASMDGAKEIGFTIVSMTLSLAAVFIPVLLMSGIVGRLFREFAVCIGVAVLVSGFVSLTLTPMMCSRFLKDPRRVHHGLMYRITEAGFQAALRFYNVTLRGALRFHFVTFLIAIAVLAASVWLFFRVPMGFIPSEDQGQVMIQTEAAQDVSFDAMVGYQQKLAEVVSKDPSVDQFFTSAGAGGPNSLGNNGRLFLTLKKRKPSKPHELYLSVLDKLNSTFGASFDTSRGTRALSADEVIKELRPKLEALPGIKTYLTNPPTINVGARMARANYQMTLQSLDTGQLYKYATELEARLRNMPEFQDVSSDLQLKNPQINLWIDRDKAMTMGVTPLQIETALDSAYSYNQISTILAPSNQYRVIVQLLPEFQTDRNVLSMLYVRSSQGQLVPLKALVNITEGVGPLQINHSGQQLSVTISFNLKGGVSLGQAVDMVKVINSKSMPSGMTCSFQGTTQAFLASVSSMGGLLVLAILVIYIVLGILYESFYHPITILSALPFAGFGALLALLIFHAELSIYAFVGIIMLIGLVKKNGIMMVDFAIEAQRKEGKSPRDAIHEACMVRFRPIMMTTMAALMAGIPIAMGYGAGGEARQPLGLAVVGGLLFSQSLTLYVTPVFFVYMEKLRSLLSRKPLIQASISTESEVVQLK
jgi:HAE1 family hydrophobic/amphiphilic exporter-1